MPYNEAYIHTIESKMSKKPPMKKSVSMFQKKKNVPDGNTNLKR